ncbi:hypothetical protein HL667_20405 [Bradyrhizobium sp. 83012]|uniref:Uncharacterized protein n=1 Tax=Bradyrhizobium aeschynomenes TaxID=2734909 RepID=A0ABX2CGQ7_9BRAD|nr:hypothetical protein [Bradyrhizobium aeschynomenes]NPU11190.1 hypothetical protein [Bradyrhizobium aeschynomenes]NPU67376.1 hypothetical protein [Bradyrhizobium aeschynomenes]NPV21852.1 hypothetical protein [Bradyrhizobium aeschynomenes]
MRKTEVSSRIVTHAALRTLRLSAVALGIGLVMAAGTARAQDDEEDDKTFEEKIIDNLMRGLGGTNMETPTIDYRERSPLVVPPKLDLPPPAAAAQATAPNWPKDPDEQRRRAAAAARKKENKDPAVAARPLTPAEMRAGRTAAAKQTEPVQPGITNNPMMSPSQLGFKGTLFGLFKGNDAETKQFTSEPQRETLTQPPPGYQTPSPSYAYGTGGSQEPIGGKQLDIMTGKER